MREFRSGQSSSMGDLTKGYLQKPVQMEKPKFREEWDKVASTYKWHFKCSSQNHFGMVKTGFSKRLGFPEMPNKPGYDHVRLLMDKIAMLQNNHYLFEKSSRIDFFIRVFNEKTDSFTWECFLSLCPTAYFVWQAPIMISEKWNPLREWIREFYHTDYVQKYVTRESFFFDGETQYREKFRAQPLTDNQKEMLSKYNVDQLLDPSNLPPAFLQSYENCCRLLNYLTFVRKAQPSQVLHLIENLNARNPQLDFKPLQPTRY